jgi:hypothetical protein
LTPERYDKLGLFYRQHVKEKNRLVFDCNVVGSHEKGFGGFPSEKPSGEEIRQITYNMGLHQIRPAFYAEDAVFNGDFKNISTVLARKTKIVAESSYCWNITTPNTITVNTGDSPMSVKLDKQWWFAGSGSQVIIPQGNHSLEFQSPEIDTNIIRLNYISGELNWAKFSANTVELSYSEDITACYISINKKPGDIFIDKSKTACTIYQNEPEYNIKLPSGTHVLKLSAL